MTLSNDFVTYLTGIDRKETKSRLRGDDVSAPSRILTKLSHKYHFGPTFGPRIINKLIIFSHEDDVCSEISLTLIKIVNRGDHMDPQNFLQFPPQACSHHPHTISLILFPTRSFQQQSFPLHLFPYHGTPREHLLTCPY